MSMRPLGKLHHIEQIPTPPAVIRAQRFLDLVESLTLANQSLVPTMSTWYFRNMIIRMAEHQLLYEDHRDGTPEPFPAHSLDAARTRSDRSPSGQ